MGELVYIGKESNAFEQVGQGLVHSRKDVQTTYRPPQQAAWDLTYLPAIRRVPFQRLVAVSGLGSRVIRYFWKGQHRPSPEVETLLREEAVRWATKALLRSKVTPEDQRVVERVLAASPRTVSKALCTFTPRRRSRHRTGR